MGTHPKAPATLASSGAKLGDSLGELGEVITKQFGAQLPFLLKILSVNQALSIQGEILKIKEYLINVYFQHIPQKNMPRSSMREIRPTTPIRITSRKCASL